MEGFTPNDALPSPNYTDVFKLLDEENIFSYYIPNLIINGVFSSPLGDRDNRPSFSVFWSYKKHKLIFKDFRYGYTGDIIDFVRYYFGYPNNTKACMRIFKDFDIQGFKIDSDINKSSMLTHSKIVTSLPRKRTSINIKITVRSWEKYDLDYWNRFGITKEWLDIANIYPISFYYLNGSIRKADKYAYAYVENKDGKFTYKIYQPFNTSGVKWKSNNDASVWELWNVLPDKHNYLIITKSRKDALSIMATTGIPATSLQAEGTIPKSHVIEELKSRFKNIFLFYDNDYDSEENWGQDYCKKLSDKFNIPYIFIPDIYETKDYSELVFKYSSEYAKNLIWKLIKKQILCN